MLPAYSLRSLLRSRVSSAAATAGAASGGVRTYSCGARASFLAVCRSRLLAQRFGSLQHNGSGWRAFASDATIGNTVGKRLGGAKSSFESADVSEQLLDLAKKYCKEGTAVELGLKFEELETREDRPWDCLDTVEFVLDVEDLFGIVIPDEAADAFESMQEVADYIVKSGAKSVTA